MTKSKLLNEMKALQKEIDQNLANTLARNQAIRDRLQDVSAKVDALVKKRKYGILAQIPERRK